MRIALLTSEPAGAELGSGTSVAITRLGSALQQRDVSVVVVRTGRHPLGATAARWRFNHTMSARLLNRYDAVLGINGDGWVVAPDLAVPYMVLIKALYAGAAAYERQPVRALLRVHARWEREGARRADLVLAPSRFAADEAMHNYGFRVPVQVVAEPFDAEAWRAALPSRPRDGTRVLCVARLYPRKRVVDLVDAWPRVVAARPDARLDIVGGGPELSRLVERARRLPNCFLHGHVEYPDLLEFHARADAFSLPSAQETFGYAAVEAMASGLPLVVTDAGAFPELCAGAVAECVLPGDTAALAGAVVRSLDRDVRSRASTLNPERARAFAPDRVARDMLAAIASAAEIRQRRAAGSDSRSEASSR